MLPIDNANLGITQRLNFKDYAIYNKALTPAEVTAHYNARSLRAP
jgi:hypothetical protein